MTSQTHLAGGTLLTAVGLGAAHAAGWTHAPAWALAVGIAWGAIAGELPDIDHPTARVSRGGVAFGRAGNLLGLPARLVGMFVRGLRVTHRGPTHSLVFLAVWAMIAAPLYIATAVGLLIALAFMLENVAALVHAGVHVTARPAIRFLLAHLAIVYPYAAACTALGYASHLLLDSLTGRIPWGWPFTRRRLALAPASLRIRTGSRLESWVVRPLLTIAAVLAFVEVAGVQLAREAAAVALAAPPTVAGGERESHTTLPDAVCRPATDGCSASCRRLFAAASTGPRESHTTLSFLDGSPAPPFVGRVGVQHHPSGPCSVRRSLDAV